MLLQTDAMNKRVGTIAMKVIEERIKKIFDRTIEFVFGLILLFLVLGISIGVIQLVATLWELLKFKGITGQYIDIITDVLTLYVLVELSRSLVEYFYSHKLRLTFIVDAGIVFVLREVLIGLFKHNLPESMIYSLSSLLLVLGLLRIGSIIVYQREKQITD
jgi:uncharacterized membrane protein (DUF373 family)